MSKSNTEILNHFYGLLIEINFNRPDEDVYVGDEYKGDPFINKHLQQIKLRSAKYRAILNKEKYQKVIQEIRKLKQVGFDQISKLLSPQEAIQLRPLFRKFEQISEKDAKSIADDQELLQLLSVLKKKLNDPDRNE